MSTMSSTRSRSCSEEADQRMSGPSGATRSSSRRARCSPSAGTPRAPTRWRARPACRSPTSCGCSARSASCSSRRTRWPAPQIVEALGAVPAGPDAGACGWATPTSACSRTATCCGWSCTASSPAPDEEVGRDRAAHARGGVPAVPGAVGRGRAGGPAVRRAGHAHQRAARRGRTGPRRRGRRAGRPGAVRPGRASPTGAPRDARHGRPTATRATAHRRGRRRRRRQARRLDQPRRRRPHAPAGGHPQGRPRRDARPHGDGRAGASASAGRRGCSRTSSARTRSTRRRSGSGWRPRRTTPRGRRSRPSTPPASTPQTLEHGGRGAHGRRSSRCPSAVSRDQGRRAARLRPGPGGRGRRARRAPGDRRAGSTCTTCGRPDDDGSPVLDVDVTVVVSSGTYVRALARDLGAALGVGGHLTALRRTRVGGYGLDVARTLDELGRLPPDVPIDVVLAGGRRARDVPGPRADGRGGARPVLRPATRGRRRAASPRARSPAIAPDGEPGRAARGRAAARCARRWCSHPPDRSVAGRRSARDGRLVRRGAAVARGRGTDDEEQVCSAGRTCAEVPAASVPRWSRSATSTACTAATSACWRGWSPTRAPPAPRPSP